MASKTDFNVSPYFDDYSEDKKFHRVMYRPAFAVQARELTTQQSITQNQIEKMGDHMFKHGAMVIPGETTVDLEYESVKLTSFNGTLSNYNGNTLTGGTSGVVANVVGFVATDGTDPDTLFVKYRNAGTDNASHSFVDGETLTSGHADAMTAVNNTTQLGCAVHIDAGTYYINGYFVNVDAQTLVLDKYTNTPDYRVGLTITESFITSTDDTTLLDNATGSSNANATGAHRFKIDLTLAKLALTSTADSNFVELVRLNGGIIELKIEATTYNILEDTLARRTFDESGDYVVDGFELDVRESLIDGNNRGIHTSGTVTANGNTTSDDLLALGLGQGVAYVKGYEVRKTGTTFVDLFKARDFDTNSGLTTRFAQLPFVNITNMYGTPDVGFVSGETEVYKKVRLLSKKHSTRGTELSNNDGTIYDIGRAKTRGIEYNAGTASGVFLSTSTLTTNTYKQYLFDIVMFSHLNVKGAGSDSLTAGETITGGTSGATATVESITSEGTATITGVTQANPPVVTMSGGHNFLEGQQILIASVAGMTDINAYHTVKNPTATTFELYAPSTASDSTPSPRDTTSSTAWSSGGTVSHTIVILSDVQGNFSAGETCTGGSSSSTVVIQFDAFGCKGIEQKIFPQTYGISGTSDPVFTADTDVSATYGKNAGLTGTISTVPQDESAGSVVLDGTNSTSANAGDSIILEDATDASSLTIALGLENPADQGDVILGSGTKFTTELRIGDQILFTDDSGTDVQKIVASIHSDTKLETEVGLATTPATKASADRQRAKMQFAQNDRSLFKLPYDVVKTLLTDDNSGLSDTSFKIRRQFVSTLSSSGTATLTAGTNEIFTAHSEADVTLSVMTKGGSATAGEVGDVITLSNSGDYTLGGSPTGKTLAIDLGSTFNGSKVKVLATISASVVGAKTKTSTTGSTLTIDTEALAATNTTINLAKADVYQINSIYMAADFSTAATTSDTDVTDRFTLDTGMRDNFYDVSRLVRKSDASAPTGRLLINFDYFEHGAGNFFSVDSYSGFDYKNIPSYTSDVTGEKFELRDVLDFRPRVDNASTINAGDGQDRQYTGTGASTIELPKFNSDITADLEFYLARKSKIFLTANGQFDRVDGEPSTNPQEPDMMQGAMHLYDLELPAYTFKTSDVKVTKIDNRRYTMRDIGRLENRLENIEYYTQLSLLESNAQNLQIQDADGFDRFKNGIIVDNFTGHGIGDVTDSDYSVSMDLAEGELRPAFHQDNASLSEISSDLSTTITDAIRTTNGYQKTGDLITLPYTAATYVEQPYASTTVNLNPYDTIPFIGNVTLTPEFDDWFETEVQPEMVINIPGSYDVLTELASSDVIDLNLGTVWNNWNDNWSGSPQEVNRKTVGRTTTIETLETGTKTRSGIRTSLVPKTVRTSLGNRVTSIAFAPFIRSKDLEFSADGMKPSTRVFAFFDGEDVNQYVTPTGSSAGAALTTDANGSCSGTFAIPDPKTSGNPKWRTGRRAFRLTTSSTNSLVQGVFSSAEVDYVAKGMMNTVQGTILSTREGKIAKTNHAETTTIQRRASRTETIAAPQEVRGGQEYHTFTQDQAGRDEEARMRKHFAASINPRQAQKDSIIDNHIRRNTSSRTAAKAADGTRMFRAGPPNRTCYYGRDPVAQSFGVDAPGGIFVPSVDLYFATKSTVLPVTVELRTMVNGYPTTEIIPFGQVNKAAADISVSSDATTATTFTFPSPVYLQPQQEYCFVVLTNTDDYTIYTARLGQRTLDDSRLISKQPYLGSMFKSQNGGTWGAEQNEDVKFKLNFCSFTTNSEGVVYLVNDDLPVKDLKQNPITTTSGSTTITIHHPNHGMHSTSANVTIAGVPSGSHNGIAHTNINGTYTTIGNIKLNSYTVTAQNSDTASATGVTGGSSVTATRNMLYDVIQPVIGNVIHQDTALQAEMRTTGGRTLEGSETEYSLDAIAKGKLVALNSDYYMTAPGMVVSAINETNEMSGSKSFVLILSINSIDGNSNLSPVIDTKKMSVHLIQNRLNNPISGTTPDFKEETTTSGGSAAAKYITKPVILENESTALDIRLSANIRTSSAVKMYYRTTSAEDVRKLGDVAWTAFNSDGTPDTAVAPAEDDLTLKEQKYSASDIPGFTAFALKIVMTGTNSSYPPVIKDMRGIALAV